jgi:YD repeat-containing protein
MTGPFRATDMVDAVGTTRWAYTNALLVSEDGPWANDTVSYGYNAARLRSSLTHQQPAGGWTQTYAYDAARRLTNVTSPAGTFGYQYPLAGRLVGRISLPGGAYITNPISHGTWYKNRGFATNPPRKRTPAIACIEADHWQLAQSATDFAQQPIRHRPPPCRPRCPHGSCAARRAWAMRSKSTPGGCSSRIQRKSSIAPVASPAWRRRRARSRRSEACW